MVDTEETLTHAYERLRHCEDPKLLHEEARRPLPDASDLAAYSRATALLEAVAGNAYTPIPDREFLAETMPFPNVLVKLSQDPEVSVRSRVAANKKSKNWLISRLCCDENQDIRTFALLNPNCTWKRRLDGAEDPGTSVRALEFLSRVGVKELGDAPRILTSMIRRGVALNPSTPTEIVKELEHDSSEEVSRAASHTLTERGEESGKES